MRTLFSEWDFALTDDRKKAILEIPFPETGNRPQKARSLLGVGVFYPDYSLEWVLRTDSSDYGVGGVLMQIKLVPGRPDEYQVIAVCSQKYSEQAMKWTTIEKEAYAIFFAVRKFSYYLIGKYFIIETDHNNLRWMEASTVAKVVHWRIYLQDFHFDVFHISGTKNTVADALSRPLFLEMLLSEDDMPVEDFERRLSQIACVHTLNMLHLQDDTRLSQPLLSGWLYSSLPMCPSVVILVYIRAYRYDYQTKDPTSTHHSLKLWWH